MIKYSEINKSVKCIALIPARSGSERIKNKNIRIFRDHPLVAYSIISALNSKIFTRVVVSTDSSEIASIAEYYGANVPVLRPKKYAGKHSPDIEWVNHMLTQLLKRGENAECFSILRPTSPFRTSKTIIRAWKEFISNGQIDSLRAVEKCSQHPAKMWKIKAKRMMPLLKNPNKLSIPWHSSPYQNLPIIFVQNACIEISWSRLPLYSNSISGDNIIPFFTRQNEGIDINTIKDWIYCKKLVSDKINNLEKIKIKPYNT